MKLLIVEGETKTVAYLKIALSEQGFFMDVSQNGEIGLELAQQIAHGLLISYVMLPGCVRGESARPFSC